MTVGFYHDLEFFLSNYKMSTFFSRYNIKSKHLFTSQSQFA